MMYDGENIKKTNMTTYEYGKHRIVYTNDKGKLFYKFNRHLMGTFKEYCRETK